MRALITGSGGLVGSACVEHLCQRGWSVIGVDCDVRGKLFGPDASTAPSVERLRKTYVPRYEHYDVDVRDRGAMFALMSRRPDFVVHAAAQPSHDKAASIPFEDFEINAVGTLNVLQAMREHCPESPMCFTSTNKVYGDNPNLLPMIETETRHDYRDFKDVDETMSVDRCTHSLFGASKLAADVLCQEYGRYFGMPTGVFRGGCLTGAGHAAVPLHGYLAYIVHCAVAGKKYTINGHKGKQVRDQLHADDVADLFFRFCENPRAGEVYNMGGGRANSVSILETIALLKSMGHVLDHEYVDAPRKGDHVCYVSDLGKIEAHFPGWSVKPLLTIVRELVEHQEAACAR